jgi:hypothetical protein
MDGNVYYNPEEFELEKVWEKNYAGSYEFAIVLILGAPATGAVYLATDSGCSCPTPFDSFTGLDCTNSMERLNTDRVEALRESITTAISSESEYRDLGLAAGIKDVSDAVAAVQSWVEVHR